MLIDIYEIFVLLVAFQFKHWICDYPMQNNYMLGKFKREGWVLPLAIHSGVHAVGTLFIVSCYNTWLAIILATVDFVVHFVVDRIKAHPDLGGRFDITTPYFWWILGLDQMAHHLTHYVIIVTVLLSQV